jgi:flagellin
MPLAINTNVQSLNAQRALTASQNSLSSSMQRLSSGLRINSARDDAAGLAISDRMNAQIKGMGVAVRNANDAISLAQTAEGSLSTVTDVLQRMRELAVQAQNGSMTASDRSNLDTEYAALNSEISSISSQTKFNGTAIINTAQTFTFQIGANGGESLNVATVAMSGVAIGGGVSTAAAASTALGAIDSALDTVTTQRATYGATINRFQYAIQNLTVATENQTSARGRILDADFAAETANLARAQILQQAGTAMVAQANALPQGVLSLLR